MKEQTISFKTAELAKEKGFNIPTIHYYLSDGVLDEKCEESESYVENYMVIVEDLTENWNDGWSVNKDGGRCFGCDKNPKYFESFSAPTQSLLQRWLRETHDIHIEVIWQVKKGKLSWFSSISKIGTTPIDLCIDLKDQDTFELALEAGLQEALQLIK